MNQAWSCTESELSQYLAKENLHGLALDIDDTLSATNKHWVTTLFGLFGNPENLTPAELWEKYGYADSYPPFQRPDAQKQMDIWRHSNAFHEELSLIAGVPKAVHELLKYRPVVAYITARPEAVLPGTLNWLNKHGFPALPVLALPSEIDYFGGSKWKAGAVAELYPYVEGIVDDSLTFVENLPAGYRGEVFLYHPRMTERTDIKVYHTPSWEAVIAQASGLK